MLSDCHYSTGGRGSIESAGAEALRVRSKVVPFPLTVLSHHCQQWHLHSSADQCQSKRSWSGHLVHAEVLAWSQQASKGPRLFPVLCVLARNSCPHPIQMQGQVQASSDPPPHPKCILSLAVAVFSISVALNQSNRGQSRNLVLSGVHTGDVSD